MARSPDRTANGGNDAQPQASLNDAAGRAVIFLHIPKSGGTTLHAIIERQYPAERIFTIDGHHVRESIAEFKALPEAERRRLQVLKGHMSFGLHNWLPQPSTYITLLRDPVERTISHYYHILRSPEHTHHATIVGKNMSLHDFMLAGVSRIVDNGQVRALCAGEDVPYGACTADMLAQAQANIEGHFTLVGFTEQFDETLILLKRALGWKMDAYLRRNVGLNRPAAESVPAATRSLIEQINEFDFGLYHAAEKRFAATIAGLGDAFVSDLDRFQRRASLRHSPVVTGAVRLLRRLGR